MGRRGGGLGTRAPWMDLSDSQEHRSASAQVWGLLVSASDPGSVRC